MDAMNKLQAGRDGLGGVYLTPDECAALLQEVDGLKSKLLAAAERIEQQSVLLARRATRQTAGLGRDDPNAVWQRS